MLYKRYGGNVRDILSMPFFEGYEMLEFALNEEINEKLFLRWAIGYQSTMSFDDFKAQIGNVTSNDERSADEILDSVKEIIG